MGVTQREQIMRFKPNKMFFTSNMELLATGHCGC